MRPVNLIPTEERRGQHSPLRTGPLAYIVVGALVLALAGVTALVLTGNQISDHKAEIAKLEREDAAAQARAQRLSSFTQFATLSEQRLATVSSLADSRFDWERVMRELALVLPRDAWLVSLNATAAAGVTIGGESGGGGASGSSAGLRGAVAGPALEISGCAAGQEAVAGFVTVLKDIDGVTRVGVQSSKLADQATGVSGNGADPGGANEDCRTRDFIAKFEIVVAFDAAPVPESSSTEAVPAPVEPESSPASTETEGG